MEVNVQVEYDLDIETMLLIKHGDEQAFEALSGKYRRPLVNFFYSLCWNIDTSQDCAQEVLLRLWLARERYQPTAKFSTYLFRIAHNQWLMFLRHQKCRPKSFSLDESWDPVVDENCLEKMMIRRYEDRRIRHAVSRLPEHYRIVFVLSHFQDMKYAEIAQVLDIPIGTVKSRMSTAVRSLRNTLSEEMRDER